MTHDTLQLELSLPMSPSALPPARHRVGAFLSAHVRDEDLEDILLCLQEAMKNAVRFSDSMEDIGVRVRLFDHSVQLVVRDHGRGFDHGSPPPHRTTIEPPDPLADSGRGLFLIAQLMDEFALVSDDGAEVRMLKRLS